MLAECQIDNLANVRPQQAKTFAEQGRTEAIQVATRICGLNEAAEEERGLVHLVLNVKILDWLAHGVLDSRDCLPDEVMNLPGRVSVFRFEFAGPKHVEVNVNFLLDSR